MKRTKFFATFALAFVLSVAALGWSAAVDTPRTLMSRDDYLDARVGIEAQTRMAVGACRAQQGVAREVCRAQAHGEERVMLAELNARYHGTVAAADEVRIAKVKARYDVERARCDAHAPGEREQCLRAAREGRTREMFARGSAI
jgi:hypothetical protein